MGRRKSAAQLQRQFQRAQAREQYKANNAPDFKDTVDKRPKYGIIYPSYLILETTGEGATATTTSIKFYTQASQAARVFYGAAADADVKDKLGVEVIAGDTIKPARIPDNFSPAKLHCKVGAAPTARKTPWNTRVIRSYRTTTNEQQAFYSHPIGSGDNNSTFVEVQRKVKAVETAIKGTALTQGDARDYGALWLEPETFNIQLL